MKKKLLFFLAILVVSFTIYKIYLNNENMKPEDYKNTEPAIKIEEYFEGEVKAWGILQDRKGKVTRSFQANMNGKFENNILTLEEDFYWQDGEKQKRIWKDRKSVV